MRVCCIIASELRPYNNLNYQRQVDSRFVTRALCGGTSIRPSLHQNHIARGGQVPGIGCQQNRYPARAQASSRHRFHCIDFLSLDLGDGLHSPLSSRAGPAY